MLHAMKVLFKNLYVTNFTYVMLLLMLMELMFLEMKENGTCDIPTCTPVSVNIYIYIYMCVCVSRESGVGGLSVKGTQHAYKKPYHTMLFTVARILCTGAPISKYLNMTEMHDIPEEKKIFYLRRIHPAVINVMYIVSNLGNDCPPNMACRCCSNYIFILNLIRGFNRLGRDNCKTRRETFEFWDLVRLILEIWGYMRNVVTEDVKGRFK